MLNICCDPAKNHTNITKHGVSLALAAQLEWDTALTWSDDRFDYGETRHCGIGYIGRRLFFVAFIDRANMRRIISLRKANRREETRYAQA